MFTAYVRKSPDGEAWQTHTPNDDYLAKQSQRMFKMTQFITWPIIYSHYRRRRTEQYSTAQQSSTCKWGNVYYGFRDGTIRQSHPNPKSTHHWTEHWSHILQIRISRRFELFNEGAAATAASSDITLNIYLYTCWHTHTHVRAYITPFPSPRSIPTGGRVGAVLKIQIFHLSRSIRSRTSVQNVECRLYCVAWLTRTPFIAQRALRKLEYLRNKGNDRSRGDIPFAHAMRLSVNTKLVHLTDITHKR